MGTKSAKSDHDEEIAALVAQALKLNDGDAKAALVDVARYAIQLRRAALKTSSHGFARGRLGEL